MELQWRTAPSLRGLRGLAVFQLQNHRFQLLQLFGLTTTLQRLGRLSFAQHWAPAAVDTVESAEARPQQPQQPEGHGR